MPEIVARTLLEITEQFKRLSRDHQTAIDDKKDGRILFDAYRDLATEAGGLIIELRQIDRGVYLGVNVRRGFEFEPQLDDGSPEHRHALWHQGVMPRWITLRTPLQFAPNAGARGLDIAKQFQRGKLRTDAERLHAAQKLVKDSRDGCDAMALLLENRADKPTAEDEPDDYGSGPWYLKEQGLVYFHQKEYHLVGKPREILQVFVRKRLQRSFTYSDLREAWPEIDHAVAENTVSEDTIRGHVGTLRKLLRQIANDFGLALEKGEPLPSIDGAWQFRLPRD